MAKAKTNAKIQTRPPVVAVMGHVDHGKTTLLDYIRKARVASSEHGGITQHIGAYQAEVNGRIITFIDTPGHAAFSAMRSRGAAVTDLVVLVVAADDGVMPQTKESISHIKAANVPMVVAINKMDAPGANVERVKKGLAAEGVLVEGYGGDVVAVPISAKSGEGVKELLEMILLVSDLAELKDTSQANFEGVVIDSSLDKYRGAVATILVKKGSLKVGDQVVSNSASGRIKALITSNGERVSQAVGSMPVGILGLTAVPAVGEVFTLGKGKVGEEKKQQERDDIFVPKVKEVRLLLKADTAGSLEAINAAIESIEVSEGKVNVVHKETGEVTESDILLAASTKSIIIAFNAPVSKTVASLAAEDKVLIRSYNLIYELLDELKEGVDALLNVKKEEVVGKAEVVAIFKADAARVAGCKVSEGQLSKGDKVNITRGERNLGTAKIKTMKHLQEDINSASVGDEFGMTLEGKADFAVGDIIEAVR
ncbi:MAG: translation initiation factor IF-2 [bacterium]|nr:translation initiation factor IF-2 [bacterium]